MSTVLASGRRCPQIHRVATIVRSAAPVSGMTRTSPNMPRVLALLKSDGAIRTGEHPDLRACVRAMRDRGELRQVLPGVYAPIASTADFTTRLAALRMFDPTAVVASTSAARLLGWTVRDDAVTAYRSGGTRVGRPGFSWLKGTVPAELVITEGGLHRTCASLTVLDLIPLLGSAAVDEGLRRGIPLPALHEALDLTPQRPGNARRRQILHDSRDKPWSPAERLGHQLLRGIGLRHWGTNITLSSGSFTATVDALHRPSRTVIEFDGWEFHSSRDAFENDRWRDLELEAAGWCVLRLTWRHLVDRADAAADLIRRVIAGRRVG